MSMIGGLASGGCSFSGTSNLHNSLPFFDTSLDQKCFCGLPALKDSITACVPKACTSKTDVQAMYDLANKFCDGAKGYDHLTVSA
jgi:hypothetical protein